MISLRYRRASVAMAAALVLATGDATGLPLREFDVYGTSRLDTEAIRNSYRAELEQLAQLYFGDDGDAYRSLRAELTDAITAGHDFAFATLTVIAGWGPPESAPVTISLDVVERPDAARRMPFRSAPTARLSDPDGLIDAWQRYTALGSDLQRRGDLDSINCDAFHCLYGFKTPELAAFGEAFDDGVRKHLDAVVAVLSDDGDASRRASAAYLLAHSGDAAVTASSLGEAIYDASTAVRNAAMRVLGQMGQRPEYARLIPIEPILAAVEFPTTYDRNKALTTLRRLVDTPERKRLVADRVGEALLAQLRLQTEPVHGPAHEVLQRISGESFGARDHAAWENWLRQQR